MPEPIHNRDELLQQLPALFAQGVFDRKIAKAWGVSSTSVFRMREELGLIRNSAPAKPREKPMPKRCPMAEMLAANPELAMQYRAGV